MKRAAEKQLIKDGDDEDDEVEEVGSGFKKADDTILAGRKIRGLPKRSLGPQTTASSAPPPPTTTSTSETAPASKFAGFSGFGSSATTSSAFTFSQPPGAPKLSPAVPAASPFTFSSTVQPSSMFGPSVSSTASPATKAFASIVSSSSSEPKPPPAVDEDQSEVDYYKALRGLNVSFLSAVSKAIESDPFVDVAALLERYKALRVSVKSDFDEKSKPPPPAPVSAFTAKAPEAPKPPATLSFGMPSAPSSFAGFKPSGPSTSTTSAAPSLGGFVPKTDSGSAPSLGTPFSFKPAASESSSTAEAPKSMFGFGSSSSTTGSSSGTSGFSFGAPSSGGSLFSKPASTSMFGNSSANPAPSIFGSSSSTSGSTSFFGAPKEKEGDKPATSIFGTGSSTPFGASSGTSSTGDVTPEKDKSSSAFSFGSASPGKPSFFGGGFGTAKPGSIGNPVGFGFGSPPRTPDPESASGPVKSLPFSFGAPKPAENASVDGESKNASSAEGTPAPGDVAGAEDGASTPLMAATSAHDKEGEGEENETTAHEIRCKVFKMTKDKEGKSQWSDMGVGMLRLKKHNDTGVRRLLMRNSSTGKITINFLIYSGMNTASTDKTVSFIGHDSGVSTPYRIRLKTADQATELKLALDREIEFVKGKSDS